MPSCCHNEQRVMGGWRGGQVVGGLLVGLSPSCHSGDTRENWPGRTTRETDEDTSLYVGSQLPQSASLRLSKRQCRCQHAHQRAGVRSRCVTPSHSRQNGCCTSNNMNSQLAPLSSAPNYRSDLVEELSGWRLSLWLLLGRFTSTGDQRS